MNDQIKTPLPPTPLGYTRANLAHTHTHILAQRIPAIRGKIVGSSNVRQ